MYVFQCKCYLEKKDTSENKSILITNDYILRHSYNFEIINL